MTENYFERNSIAGSDYVVTLSPDKAKKKELTALMAKAGLQSESGLAISDVVKEAVGDKLDSKFDVGYDSDHDDGKVILILRLQSGTMTVERLEKMLASIKKRYAGLDYAIEDRTNLPDDDPMDG